jgi:hypothetical protein
MQNQSKVVPEIGKVTLCGVQGCCPTIDFSDPNFVVITDDYGGTVKMKREHWTDLKAKFPLVQSQQH